MNGRLRQFATGLVGLTLACLVSSYIWFGNSMASVVSVQTRYKLPQPGVAPLPIPKIPTDVLKRAILAAPLDQPLLNAVVVARSAGEKPKDFAQAMAVLKRMGWRDPSSLQNIIIHALETTDIPTIVDCADALLRQDVLIEQTSALMVLLEGFADTAPTVVARLKQGTPWRYTYLERAGSLTAPDQISGRLNTLTTLMAGGAKVQRQEVGPFVMVLAAAGEVAQARNLWLTHTGQRRDVLLDPDFTAALNQSKLQVMPVPFEWQFGAGLGSVADIAADGLSGNRVSIQWDGRGVPVFVSQQTGAGEDRYQLFVRVEGEAAEFARRIGFRLRCGEGAVAFEDPVALPGNIMSLTLPRQNVCDYPVLEVFGKVQDVRRAVDVAFSSIRMQEVK